MHSPYWYPGFCMTRDALPQDNRSTLVQIMLAYCAGHRGSVASERMQSHLWVRFRDLYCAVVGRGGWHKFVRQFPHMFELLSPRHTISKTWRVRLIESSAADWRYIDAKEFAKSQQYKRDLVHRTLGLLHEARVSHMLLRDILRTLCPDMRSANLTKILRRSALLGVADGHVYLLKPHFD